MNPWVTAGGLRHPEVCLGLCEVPLGDMFTKDEKKDKLLSMFHCCSYKITGERLRGKQKHHFSTKTKTKGQGML